MENGSGISLSRFAMEELRILPFEFLLGAGVVGVFAVLLLLHREKLPVLLGREGRVPVLGLGLGAACVALTLLMPDHISGGLKPVLALLDFIFIAGLIGGWRSALVTFACALSSRYFLTGGPEAVEPSLATIPMIWNYGSFAIAGMAANRYLLPHLLGGLNVKTIAALILWRFVCTATLLALCWEATGVSRVITAEILVRRFITSFTVSAFTVTAVLLLLRQALEQERRLYTDSVTRYPNRRALQRYLTDIFNRKKEEPSLPHTLMLLEIDNLQQLIQSYGHTQMDIYGRWFARELSKTLPLRSAQGHEPRIFSFAEHVTAVILSGITKEQVREQGLAQNFLNSASLLSRRPGNELSPAFTLSIIDIELQEGNDPVHFLRTVALLEKRHSGQVQFFETDMARQVQLEEGMLVLLSQWIEKACVPLGFQPKVAMGDGSCYGAESLLRPQTADGAGHASPPEVLAIAEKYGLRNQLEWAIVCSAINTLAQLPPGLEHLKISVNITPDILLLDSFGQRVINLLRKKSIEPDRLIIEIIETSRFVPGPDVHSTLTHLTDHGVILSLDDFGTGYSSISLLSQCPFKELKLDYSMISKIDDPRVYSAIQLSIEGAQKYQATVVAEGIETLKQRIQLLGMGVTYGQGFLFGKAMPLDEFVAYALRVPQECFSDEKEAGGG